SRPAMKRSVAASGASAKRPPHRRSCVSGTGLLSLRLRSHGKPRALRCQGAPAHFVVGHVARRVFIPTAVGVVYHATAVAGCVNTKFLCPTPVLAWLPA